MVQLDLGIVHMDVSVAELVVSIIAVCLTAYTIGKQRTKFRLFVDPGQGYVSLGGSITTRLLVKGSYRNEVELSISNKPPGVHIAFAPDKVIPRGRLSNFFNKSSGISTISINVSRDAEDGLYPIQIVGTEVIGSGSSASSLDDRWHNSCIYYLFCGNVR